MKYILIFFFSIGIWNISKAQCDDFTMSISASHPTCYNFNDGDIDLTISGGTSPYHVTITDENGTIWNGGKKSNNLGPGWYFILITDSNGCEIYDSIQLINPPQMIAQVQLTDPSFVGACDGVALVDTVLHYQGDYTQIGYFWSPGGPMGTGENLKTNLCDANYTLTINDAYGCSITESLAVGSVSVDETNTNQILEVFPNPFADQIHIGGATDGTLYSIASASGKLILNGELKNETINGLENLPSGVYLLILENDDTRVVQRIVK